MKLKPLYILAAAVLLPSFTAGAQAPATEKFAIKATADIGLGKALTGSGTLPGMDTKSSMTDFGLDFGWTFWQQREHSVEANIGLRYGRASFKAGLASLDYNYQAPAAADMDNDTYIRYYELSDLHQKITTDRVSIPIYARYRYEINPRIGVHAILGFKIGLNASSKVSATTGSAFSYGIYPQYDDLMIDASYMNEFGRTNLAAATTLKPETASATVAIMAGVGAEVKVWGPISADLTIKYEGAMSNMYKRIGVAPAPYTATTAPVTYTVAGGQTVAPLCSYLSSSKPSRLSLAISAIYRF